MYEIRELEPLPGYQQAPPVTIEVKAGLEKQYFEMKNKQIEVHVKKVDSETREPVEGAYLQLFSNPGTASERLVEEWLTDGNVKMFTGLIKGEYEIREKTSPEGYAAIKPVRFQVTNQAGIQEVVIENQKIQVEISKENGKDHKPVAGAKLQLVREMDGQVVREWISKEEPEAFKGLPFGRYIIREVEAPAGYKKMEPVTIEVKDQAGVQAFSVYNYKITHTPDKPGGVVTNRMMSTVIFLRSMQQPEIRLPAPPSQSTIRMEAYTLAVFQTRTGMFALRSRSLVSIHLRKPQDRTITM